VNETTPAGRANLIVDNTGQELVVGLAGQPNVGKSTIFNLLTGLNQHVGNWPGKTVERKEGVCVHDGARLRIIDLPGTYSLTAGSEEERVTRDFLLHEHPDVIIMVADASALERNLYLLAELLALPVPIVLGLNMMDIAEEQGVDIEPHVLQAALGLPVVPLVASRNQGVSRLLQATIQLARKPQDFQPTRPTIAEPHREILEQVKSLLHHKVPKPYSTDWVAMKLLEGDSEITQRTQDWLAEDEWQPILTILAQHEDAILDIAGGRYEWIGRMVRAAITQPQLGQISFTDRFDRIAVHPVWGLLLLLGAFGLVFLLTFTVASPIQEWLDVAIVERLRTGLTSALVGSPSWLVGLLANGVIGGVGIVITFLPILIIFFTVLAFLEDTGYLARAAYVMDRFMHALGLHGKSFIPLFLGFGCNVPAVMGTRVIGEKSGRLLTILLAPLVPCSGRLIVLAFLAPIFFGSYALLAAWSLVAFNMLILAIVGVLLNRTVFSGQHAVFIMELPLYHIPNLRTIAFFVWNNIRAFLRKAATIILLVSVLVWAFSNFPGPDVEHSYLARIGHALVPIGGLMGMDWRMIVALLSGFIAKENVIATLGILHGTGAETVGLAKTMSAGIDPATGLAFLVVNMLFIPCVATVAVMHQETRSWRWTLFSVLLLLVISFSAGIIFYQCARWFGIGS
jgi:ferrous iron transport protein B